VLKIRHDFQLYFLDGGYGWMWGRDLTANTGVLRCAQDDDKNEQRQERTTARTNNSKNEQQQERTTARTNNSKNGQQQEQATAGKSQGRNKQRQRRTTTKTGNGKTETSKDKGEEPATTTDSVIFVGLVNLLRG
jgi:hypothetical protein